ncbi:heme peroxidase [Penicillium nucicola]|uniref:heme peroxidase n=1 Tax=Penicillium nucicola TaxID=1850975 RepID=UPI00254538A0|nr:heme peroxidase [Penicillium nucicola]KAJ5762475.1 heme peroxidase [Penicillium nucicola]
MIGDLTDGATTVVGRRVRDCIASGSSCEDQSTKSYERPGDLESDACQADSCCVWDFIQQDLVPRFRDGNGTCNGLARAAVRLGFHDAGAWSTTSGAGGADGSLVLSSDEIDRPENNGLQEIRSEALRLLDRYPGVSAADLVQFMHNIATVTCPLGPRMLTLVGREDSRDANPAGLIPGNNGTDASYLIELFENKTISARDLGALLGAHTVARQFHLNPSRAGQGLDTTPGIWDMNFYREMALSSPPPGVFRLPSDEALSQADGTSQRFQAFTDVTFGQTVWNRDYSSAYARLSLLGVNKINQLSDCTRVLPDAVTSFSAPSASSSASAGHGAWMGTGAVCSYNTTGFKPNRQRRGDYLDDHQGTIQVAAKRMPAPLASICKGSTVLAWTWNK